MPYFRLSEESRYTGCAPESTTPWCTLLWQLRSRSSFSPGASSVWKMTLFAVEVPLVAKKVRRAPKALAAICCASLMTPFGSISESSIGTDTDRSASNTCSPMNS
jgi:hypothetical protein